MVRWPREYHKWYFHLTIEILSTQLPIAALLQDAPWPEELTPSTHSWSHHRSPWAECSLDSLFPTRAGWAPPPSSEWLWWFWVHTFLFQIMMYVLRLPVNSSAQITSAECCVLVTQDTDMTGRGTGGGRSRTVWVRWWCALFLGSWGCARFWWFFGTFFISGDQLSGATWMPPLTSWYLLDGVGLVLF